MTESGALLGLLLGVGLLLIWRSGSRAPARKAGLAIGTAPDPVTGQARALRAAQLAVEDQSINATDLRVAYAPAGASCAPGASVGA